MGCTCLGGSQIEQFLTDFIDELKIRCFSDKKFVDFIERTNPFASNEAKFNEFLASAQRNNIPEHERYSEDLLGLPRQNLNVALLFLTKSDAKSLAGQYLILVDRLKNKFSEVFSKRLDDFYRTDYEVLRTVLLFYCKMISFDVVHACARAQKPKITYDQANQLKAIYGAAVIEHFVNNELMKDCNTATLNHEEFFQRNFQSLQHHYVRERLRSIWTSKFAPVFQKELTGKEGKIYTLNSNVELEKPREETVYVQQQQINYVTQEVSEPMTLVSARAPIYTTSTASASANPMNATVYFPSQGQQQSNVVRRTIDLTNGNSDLGLVASGNISAAAFIQEKTGTYVSPYTNASANASNYDSEWYKNLVNNNKSTNSNTAYVTETDFNKNNYLVSAGSPTAPRVIQQQITGNYVNNYQPSGQYLESLNLPSLVSSGKAAVATESSSAAYIDPYNNATNKFLYGKEKIEAADVKNLPTRLFMTLKQYRKDCLQLHNETRSLHQTSELVEDAALTERAQEWANSLAEADLLNHSDLLWNGKAVGENIAKGSAVLDEPAKLVCSKWYSEIVNYNFAAPGAQASTKNFTQMVWKDSKQVGFGLAYSKRGNTYVVVNYFPAGNDEAKLKENVLAAANSAY